MDRPGTILDGRYCLLELAGQGGMATVWRAARLDRYARVAVKRMLAGTETDPELIAMFLDEARVTAGLSHPNIVRLEDSGSDRRGPFLVLEWVEGASARELQRDRRMLLPQEVALPIARDVLSALSAAHMGCAGDKRHPVIHRDVSPCNILIDGSGLAKLADFGLARSLAHPRTHRRGSARGKPSYLPPEVLLGGPHGVRGDLYSLGVVLWELLAGQALFAEIEDTRERAKALLAQHRPPLRSIREDVDPEVARVIDRAMETDPSRRFGSAREMLGALAHLPDDCMHRGILSLHVQHRLRSRAGARRASTVGTLSHAGPQSALVVAEA